MIIMVILYVLLIGCIYLLCRNFYVYKYQMNLSNKIYNKIIKDVDSYIFKHKYDYKDRPSYESMLLSFKPLKDEYWLSEDFINWLETER